MYPYNNGFNPNMQAPMPYGQPAPDQLSQLRQMQQPQGMPNQQMMPQQTQQSDMLWVQGEAAAKAYIVVALRA